MMPCPKCSRIGWVFSQIKTEKYACGFYMAVRVCSTCHGKKWIPTVHDQKMAAAGERNL